MDDMDYSHDTSNLSQSYIKGVKRITGTLNGIEDNFGISESVSESRKHSWESFFEKFSQVSDDLELNLETLKPDASPDRSASFEYRFPTRKTKPQLQYWIDTGNPPCRMIVEEVLENTRETLSISESEASESDKIESSSIPVIDNKISGNNSNRFIGPESSCSSVDTATYIRTNGKTRVSNFSFDKDSLVANFINIDNNRVFRSVNAQGSKVSLSTSMELPNNVSNTSKNSVSHKIITAASNHSKNSHAASLCQSDTNKKVSGTALHRIDELIESNEFIGLQDTSNTKESGIGSTVVQSTESNRLDVEDILSLSSNVARSVEAKSRQVSRKLYSGRDSPFDLSQPMVESSRTISSHLKSIHPAFSNCSNITKKEIKSRPRSLLPKFKKLRRLTKTNRTCISGKHSSKSTLLTSKNGNHSKISHRHTLSTLIHSNCVKTSNSKIEKIYDNLNSDAQISEKTDAIHVNPKNQVHSGVKQTSPKLDTSKKGSPTNISSSLSSNDASKIINEELQKILESPFRISAKKQLLTKSSTAKIQNFRTRQNNNNKTLNSEDSLSPEDQDSVSRTNRDTSCETVKLKARDKLSVKKNLYKTDLESSTDTSSLIVHERNKAEDDKDVFSDASTIIIHDLRKRKTGSYSKKKSNKFDADNESKISIDSRLAPVIILHDCLCTKNCCKALDRKNYKQWLQKENRNPNQSLVNESFDKKASEIDKVRDEIDKNIETKKLDDKISATKKLKLVNKVNSPEIGRKIISRRNDDSESLEESLTNLKYDKLDELPNERTITFALMDTKDNKEPIFTLTSSDEEDIFKKLTSSPKLGKSKRKSTRNQKTLAIESSIKKNQTIDSSAILQSTTRFMDSRFNSMCYKIVSSASEDENNTVSNAVSNTKVLRKTRKSSTWRKQKNSLDSVPMTHSRQNKCPVIIENLEVCDEKLKNQSPSINKHLVAKKSKQWLEIGEDVLVAQSKVNNKSQNDEELCEKERRNSDKSNSLISNKTNEDTFTDNEIEISEKDNYVDKIVQYEKTSIDQGLGSKRGKKTLQNNLRTRNRRKKYSSEESTVSLNKNKKESPNKMRGASKSLNRRTLIESSESEEESVIERMVNFKDRGRRCFKITDKNELINDTEKILSDKSSYSDDTIIVKSKNNAGSHSVETSKACDSGNTTSKLHKHFRTPKKNDRTAVEKCLALSSRKTTRNQKRNSTIVFQTKEYWESDSDNS